MPTQSRFPFILVFISLFGVALTSGCSEANKNSVFDPNTGHAAGWSSPSVHGATAKTEANGFEACRSCHGSDFSGGISATACFTCHGVNAPHAPAPWRGGTITHTTTNPGNAPACALCHTNGSNSSIQPSPSAPAGTAPGCFNGTLCHAAAGHPAGWSAAGQHGASAKAQPAASAGFAFCETCHGSNFAGGSSGQSCFTCHGGTGPHPTSWIAGTYTHTNVDTGNAPVCSLCHANGANSPIAPPTPAASAGTAPGCFNNTLCHATIACGTCHGIPPSGSAAPNVAGTHGVHSGMGAYLVCDTCHTGAGSGTAKHQNSIADVAFSAAYNAKGATASFNASANTCSRVSCHGGQATPNWLTGSIDVNTQCGSCHASGTAQYNGYTSGQHVKHVVDKSFACTVCHDTVKLAINHFTTLNTTVMEGPANATLLNSVNYNGASCSPACHGNETW